MIIHTKKELTDHINACIAVGCGVELAGDGESTI
jgi:hypothetical protein